MAKETELGISPKKMLHRRSEPRPVEYPVDNRTYPQLSVSNFQEPTRPRTAC